MKIIRVFGYILLIISICIVIAGLFANKGSSIEYAIILIFAGLAIIGFVMSRYQKKWLNFSKNKTERDYKKNMWMIVFIATIVILVFLFIKQNKTFGTYFAILFFIFFALGIAAKISKKKEMSDEKKEVLTKKIKKDVDMYVEIEQEKDYQGYETQEEYETIDILESGFSGFPEFKISYLTANGEPSNRVISLKSISLRENKVYLNAFCHLRKEDRMFLTDRIQRLEYENEVISDPVKYFYNIFKNSDAYDLQNFAKKKADVLKLFIFLVKADGKMTKAEVDVLIEYLRKHKPLAPVGTADYIIRNIPVISISQFQGLIKEFKKETADNEDILEYYKKLYELKKTPDPLERGVYEKVMNSLQA